MDQTAQNLQLQTDLYGEPLGDLIRRIAGTLGLTQARVADVIGLSAPMLSQLMSAQRVKIGNPNVVSRLQALDEFARRDGAVNYPRDVIDIALLEIGGSSGAFTKASTRVTESWTTGPGPSATQPMTSTTMVRMIQDLFREVASAREIERAAELISAESPRLAELLMIYGTGRTDDAVAHFQRRSG
ncbi:helix-turn-helix domain-containing protein [Kribbella italica]|uniref:Transcriptional regulator with XRE-family HTH domain n=1 Tax=Kribbella italica TaxID=1540520 RepID=A0A7W9J878_9ACTN|nr:DNA-binding protein [Kribbella italica]MBB5836950.1 transcriptional regulator with XRE-family HTH domain [Kribbella italica]